MKMKALFFFLVIPLILSGCFVEGTVLFDGDDSVVIVEFASVDREDGFIDPQGIFLERGILVEEDYSSGYLSFHTHLIPHNALITNAFLFIGVHRVFPSSDSVVIDLFVDPGIFFGSFEIFIPDENNYVLLDVTDLVFEAHRDGIDIIQIFLEARGGGAFFEDGGNNFLTGLIPVIEVSYF